MGGERCASTPPDDDATQMMATLGDLRRNYRQYRTGTQFKMIYGADCPDAANPQLHDTPAHPHFQTDVWFSFSHGFQLIKSLNVSLVAAAAAAAALTAMLCCSRLAAAPPRETVCHTDTDGRNGLTIPHFCCAFLQQHRSAIPPPPCPTSLGGGDAQQQQAAAAATGGSRQRRMGRCGGGGDGGRAAAAAAECECGGAGVCVAGDGAGDGAGGAAAASERGAASSERLSAGCRAAGGDQDQRHRAGGKCFD
jgi:hypothetical protein